MEKTSSSEAAWALIIEGVAQARLDAHRLRHLVSRATSLVEKSEKRDHLHQVAGDIIRSAPERLSALEEVLDRTALALVKLGETFLEARLPLSQKQLVKDSVSPAFGGGLQRTSESRVIEAWLRQADRVPALGLPSEAGPCHVVDRIFQEVRHPRMQDSLRQKVEKGKDLPNPDAKVIYSPLKDRGAGYFKTLQLTSHAQYRMDLRGITIQDVRVALKDFSKQLNDWKSQHSPHFLRVSEQIARGEKIEHIYNKWGLLIVFKVPSRGVATLITTYWKGVSDSKAPVQCRL